MYRVYNLTLHISVEWIYHNNENIVMFASRIEAYLTQLQKEVNDCEKTLRKLITVKKNMTENSPSHSKILPKFAKTNPENGSPTDIAIIGMASIFPNSQNLQEYWENIIQKVDCITDVPPSRWRIEDYYDPNPKTPDKTYCKRGGFIPDIDFDPLEFGLPPNLLEVTDISQLLGLVVAKAAITDAGYGESRQFNRDRTGVILGVATGRQLGVSLGTRLQYPIWEKVLRHSGLSEVDTQKIIAKLQSAYVQWDENAFPGMLGNVIAGRIANRLDLGGINCVVDAACASSLGALRMCISELVEHRADMMLTGGVDTDNSAFAYMCFSKTPAVSPSENVKPFDVNSDGMMLGEGVGMLVLKRLSDARRDGDRIYAVIKGIGSSSDGRSKSIYAPHAPGQVKALERAYTDAGISPETVGLVEAHGTGTMVGDRTEFESIRQVFESNHGQKQYIALGSVKSQIGHTKAAAGAASLIKTALALHHKVLPPTINVTQPHPKLHIEDSPFYLNTETRPWISPPHQSRRAGVSAFGFGGTNYHVILEEYTNDHEHKYRLNDFSQIVLLSAPTPQELISRCREVEQQLQSDDGEKYYAELIQDAENLTIPQTNARIGFVVNSIVAAREFLQIGLEWLNKQPEAKSWEHPQGIYYRQSGIDTTGKVVALFSGQGSQYLGMGKELTINFPFWRYLYNYMDQLLCEDGLHPISDIVFPQPVFDPSQKASQLEKLQLTEYAQPALGVFSAGLYRLLTQAGFQPDFLAGHSFGELTALWAGGVLTELDYLFLVKARGQAMAAPCDPDFDAGGMLAVKGDGNTVAELIRDFPQVTIANRNSQRQVVVAGKKTELAKVEQAIIAQGFATIPLKVSAAFHTPLVAHAQKPFAQALTKVCFQQPRIPIYSNVTGDRYPSDPQAIAQILKEQLRNQVLFQQQIENIYAAGGYCFVEFGPRNVLTNLVKEILTDKPHLAIALNPNHHKNSDRSLRESVVQLRVAGLPLKNLDPYQAQIPGITSHNLPKNPAKISLNVKLNGSNLGKKAEAAFSQALVKGDQVSLQPVEQTNGHSTLLKRSNLDLTSVLNHQNPESHNGNGKTQLDNMSNNHGELGKSAVSSPPPTTNIDEGNSILADFHRQQSAIVKVHEQSLQNQAEYNRSFFHLIQRQDTLWKKGDTTPEQQQKQELARSISERSLMWFHEHQTETLRIYEQYLQNQQEFIENHFQLLSNYDLLRSGVTQPRLQLSAPPIEVKTEKLLQIPEISGISETEKSIPLIDPTTLNQTLLNIVSDKTGYPVDMLDMSMNMESDLGIDSIKRVEILGGLLEIYPNLPKPNPEEVGQLQTLNEIATYIRSLIPNLLDSTHEVVTELILPVESQPVTEIVETVPDDLSHMLFNIVSDKTGYPVEMLDLSLNIESDLGIDSIKRVEILGGLLELYPDLPKPSPEELAELSTLGEILQFIEQKATQPKLLSPTEFATPLPELHQSVFRSPVRLKQLPQPDGIEETIPENQIALITNDGSPMTEELATALLNQGWTTVVLNFPNLPSTSITGVDQVILSDWSEETLTETFQNISQKYGAIATFIHLHPATHSDRPEISYLETDKLILRYIFLTAKTIAKHLQKLSCFFSVVRLDGKLGCGATHNFGVISGGLSGLIKSLNREWENVFCRSLDLSPDIDTEIAVKHILAELQDPNRLITEVGYTRDDRFTLVADSLGAGATVDSRIPISAEETFLVTGGGKGITAKCVIKLAQEYKCKFILVGRSTINPEPAWSQGCEEPAKLKRLIMEDFQSQGEKPTPLVLEKKFQEILSGREIQATLQVITDAGGQAEYISVDITDRVMLGQKLAESVKRLGAITGIIHGAGNLADKWIEKKTIQDFETVYAAKVTGLENLLQCVPPQQLRYLILFSSVVGFYGNTGQTDYAIANEILNKSAHLFHRFHPNCRAIACNWGPWDTGMVSPELKKFFAEHGIESIPAEIGMQMLVDEMTRTNKEDVQIVMGSPLIYIPQISAKELKVHHIHRRLTLSANPFLYDHVIVGRPVLPATCGLLWMANACEQLYPGFQIFSSLNFKVLKGIVFDDNFGENYLLELQETAKIEQEEINISARISSATPTGKIRYHFSADLILKRKIPPIPSYEFVDFHQDEQFIHLNQRLYQNGSSSLFHGTIFQGVKSVLNASPNKLTIECYLPQLTEKQQGQFPVQTFNPYIADVQIHALWICTQHFDQVGCLPAEIKKYEQFAPVPFNQTFYVTCEIKSKTPSNIQADVIAYSPQGEIYNRMFNAKGTILTRQVVEV